MPIRQSRPKVFIVKDDPPAITFGIGPEPTHNFLTAQIVVASGACLFGLPILMQIVRHEFETRLSERCRDCSTVHEDRPTCGQHIQRLELSVDLAKMGLGARIKQFVPKFSEVPKGFLALLHG